MAVVEEDDHTWQFTVDDDDQIIAFGIQESFMRAVSMTTETQPMEFPEGTIEGKWRISVVGGAILEAQNTDIPKATFLLPAGEYAGSAQRLNAGGADIGPSATTSFTVTDVVAVVTIDVAKSLTVTME